MESTEAHLCNWVELHAALTFDQVQVRPHLPIDFLPRDTVGLSHKGNEFLKIPVFIDNMFGSHLTVRIYKTSPFTA